MSVSFNSDNTTSNLFGDGGILRSSKLSVTPRDFLQNFRLREENRIGNRQTLTLSQTEIGVKQNKEILQRIQNGPFAGLAIRSGVVKETDSQHPRAIKIIDDLTAYIKIALFQKTKNELHNAIKDQFKLVRIMKDDGTWIDPALTKISHNLIPSEEDTLKKCSDFIDAVAAAAKNNPYLLAAIDNLDEKQLEVLRQKANRNGIGMVQYVIPYAMALNSLTDAFVRDVDLLDRIDKQWSKEKKPYKIRKFLNLFGTIKYYTLNHLSKIKKPIKIQKVSSNSNHNYLNFNIIEAVIADLYSDNTANAKAGCALVQRPVGSKSNHCTGAGPVSIGTKRGYDILEFRPHLPKQWADLYAVWNLAFCSISDQFPLLIAKLLIPSVNDYTSNPEGYIFHRVYALYLYFQFAIFRRIDGEEPAFLKEWHVPDITRAFGQANATSAQDYKKQVKASRYKF